MQKKCIKEELGSNSYPGRGIIIGKSEDGTKAVTAYFIMGRSSNSRNRVFVEDGEGIRTEAFDPSKLEDPSLIIYAPVRVLGNKTIVTNGDQTDTIYDGMDHQLSLIHIYVRRRFAMQKGADRRMIREERSVRLTMNTEESRKTVRTTRRAATLPAGRKRRARGRS